MLLSFQAQFAMPSGRPHSRSVGSSLPLGFGGQRPVSHWLSHSAMQPHPQQNPFAWPPQMLASQPAPQYGQQPMMVGGGMHPFMMQQAMMQPQMMPASFPGAVLSRTQSMQGADSAFMQIQHQAVPGQMNMQDSMSQHATSVGPMAGPSPAPLVPQPQGLALAGQPAQPGPHVAAAAGAQIDDDHKLSTSYRVLGSMFKHGLRATIPKKMRVSAMVRVDPNEWTIFRMSLLDECQTDCLLYILSAVRPSTRISDLSCKTKGHLPPRNHRQ